MAHLFIFIAITNKKRMIKKKKKKLRDWNGELRLCIVYSYKTTICEGFSILIKYIIFEKCK